MKRIGPILLTFCIVMGGFYSTAQEPSRNEANLNTRGTSNDDEGVPEAKHVAEIALDSGRVVTIHYSGQGKSNKSANIYYHRPIFAFVESSSPLNGYPPIVQSVVEDGATKYLGFTVIASTPEFREVCAEQVRQEDMTLRNSASEVTASSIDCRRWPLKQARIKVLDLYTKQIFAQGSTESLISKGDSWDFALAFTESGLKRFLAVASEKGRIGFVFSYTYENVTQQSASLSVRANVAIQQSLEKAFSSIKKNMDSPLFQDQYTEITSALKTDVNQTIRTTDISLLSVLSTDWVTKLFDKPTMVPIDKLENTDSEFQKQAAEYIKPLLEKETKKSEDASKDTQHTSEKTNLGAKVSIPTGTSGSTEVSASKEALNEMTKEHGVTFTQQKDTETFVPHEIKVYRLSSSWQQSTMNDFQQVFLVTGSSASYFEDSPVSPKFTSASLKSLDDLTGGLKPFSGFAPGMMVCQLSSILPPGFVWADGTSNWPNENWVPTHLRGKPVPNLSEMVIGSTTVESEVGTVFDSGAIPVPPLKQTVSSQQVDPKLYAMEFAPLAPVSQYGATYSYVVPLYLKPNPPGPTTELSGTYLAPKEVVTPVMKYEVSTQSVLLNSTAFESCQLSMPLDSQDKVMERCVGKTV
jgi:hypothetical protein